MAQSGVTAAWSIPKTWDISMAVNSATGTINPGDWLFYSGQFVLAGYSGLASTAYYKTSGAGVAMESNPVLDPAGRSIQNSAMKVLVEGILVVSANASGQPALGLGAFPVASGSGVAGTTGLTGLGATWQTAQVFNGSALSGTANGQAAAVATVIGFQNPSNAGTGEYILRLQALAPDVRG